MEKPVCNSCQSQKALYSCRLCQDGICKSCVSFLEDEQFAFDAERAARFPQGAYCGSCWSGVLSPEVEDYDRLLERAKAVDVFFKTQTKETRLMKRKHPGLAVDGCRDREEAVLRLAYLAAKEGFETLIDVDVTSKKIRDGAYQTSQWSGRAVPYRR